MSDILNILKKEFDYKNGISLDTDKTLEIIRALEKTIELHKAWVYQYYEIERLQNREYELETRITELEKEIERQKTQRKVQYDIIEMNRKSFMMSYEDQATRIKHLEDIIERIKTLNSDFLYDHDLAVILNEA